MQKRYYVGKPGYWVYDPDAKTVSHQHTYPYHNIRQWLYAGSPGYIVIEDDKILDFYPDSDERANEPTQPFCYHIPKEYIGFTDKFMYCSKCGVKL